MKYYAIADLHGRYDLLAKADAMILAHSPEEDFKIITLGDYIDRGPDSKKVIEWLMTSDYICLQGNHESMAVESITRLPNINWWGGNGGYETLESYGHKGKSYDLDDHYAVLMPQGVIPDEHVKWMASLPLYYETEKQLFVHAGVPQDNMNLPPRTSLAREQMQWMIYDRNTAGGWKGKHVVHGHHQFEDGPHVWSGPKGGRTDLDCYAYKTGRLVIGVFDDTQGPAKEFIEVKL